MQLTSVAGGKETSGGRCSVEESSSYRETFIEETRSSRCIYTHCRSLRPTLDQSRHVSVTELRNLCFIYIGAINK